MSDAFDRTRDRNTIENHIEYFNQIVFIDKRFQPDRIKSRKKKRNRNKQIVYIETFIDRQMCKTIGLIETYID